MKQTISSTFKTQARGRVEEIIAQNVQLQPISQLCRLRTKSLLYRKSSGVFRPPLTQPFQSVWSTERPSVTPTSSELLV